MPKRSLALEFLIAAYGPDKLADPTQAEPVVQRMIQLAPNEPTNYFQLAKIYEDSGEYQLAEETYLKGRDAKPNDPTVYLTVAGYYNRQGDFDKLIENIKKNIELEPQNPEAHYRSRPTSWDKASRDFRLSDEQKMEIIMDGLTSVNKALEIKSDYVEAMTYKGLLLRTQALIEKDPGEAAGADSRRHGAQRQGQRDAEGQAERLAKAQLAWAIAQTIENGPVARHARAGPFFLLPARHPRVIISLSVQGVHA